MKTKLGRAALVGVAAAALTALNVQVGVAAGTDAISYEAVSDGTGIGITLAPSGQPAQVFGGGITSALANTTPSAKGSAEAVKGNAATSVGTEAPPDGDPKHAEGGSMANRGIPDVLTISGAAGSADSRSEAKDETPSTENLATFGSATVTAGSAAVLQAVIKVGAVSTDAAADGVAARTTSSSTSSGVVISLSVEPAVLQALDGATNQLEGPLCGGLSQLPGVGPQVGSACAALFSSTAASVEYASFTIGEGSATCTWKDATPSATGQGATVVGSILGQKVIDLKPGSTPTTLGAGTPLELTVGAGSFVSPDPTDGDVGENDSVNATASGASLDLLAKNVRFAFSSSSCSLTAKIPPDDVLSNTGGALLPSLLGGAGLVAGAAGLRRFLRKR